LTIIDGHAQRLAKMNGAARPHEITQRSGKIRGAVLRMTSLIDSLLGSTQIIDGELYFHPTSFDMHALLHEVCHLHRESHRDLRSGKITVRSLCRWKETQNCYFK